MEHNPEKSFPTPSSPSAATGTSPRASEGGANPQNATQDASTASARSSAQRSTEKELRHIRNQVAALCEEVARLRAERNEALELLDDVASAYHPTASSFGWEQRRDALRERVAEGDRNSSY